MRPYRHNASCVLFFRGQGLAEFRPSGPRLRACSCCCPAVRARAVLCYRRLFRRATRRSPPVAADYRIGPQRPALGHRVPDQGSGPRSARQQRRADLAAADRCDRRRRAHRRRTGAGNRCRYRARYLQDPQVTVFVKEFVSQRVTVNGAVKKTGIFPMTSRADAGAGGVAGRRPDRRRQTNATSSSSAPSTASA